MSPTAKIFEHRQNKLRGSAKYNRNICENMIAHVSVLRKNTQIADIVKLAIEIEAGDLFLLKSNSMTAKYMRGAKGMKKHELAVFSHTAYKSQACVQT